MTKTVAKSHEIDMLHGRLFFKILLFTLPIIGSAFLQQLFSAVDMVVVGKFEGELALGAVGTTTSLTGLVLSLFIGLSGGAGACISVSLGARRQRDTSEFVHTAMLTALISGILIGTFGFFAAPKLLLLLNVEGKLYEMATAYMRVYFLGAPALLVYNFGFAIMRTIGDTRRPLLYMLLAGIVNIGFNLLFVAVFHLGVVGVALGTVLSLLVSAILVTISLMRYQNACRLFLRQLKIHPRRLAEILRIGIPAGLNSALFGIANTMLQSATNTLGPVATSGNAAAASLESFLYLFVANFGQSATVFAGQNYGAGYHRRIRRVFWLSSVLAIGFGIFCSILMLLMRRTLVGLYVPADASREVIEFAYQRMLATFPVYFLFGVLDVIIGTLRGMKISLAPTIANVVAVCGFRLSWIFFVFPLEAFHNVQGLYSCYPFSWTASSIAVGILLIRAFIRRCPLSSDREGKIAESIR